MTAFGPIASTDWLAEHFKAPHVKIIDGSWRMPGAGAAVEDYRKRHIEGAVFFDIDAIADRTTPLPHMLPPQETFEQAVGAMGMTERDTVIVYDDKGIFSAARVWWTFRAMGHDAVAVLDGGLLKWLAENRPVTSRPTPAVTALYKATPQRTLCAGADEVRTALSNKTAAIADARPAPRFQGQAEEPRPGLRSGAMPGAVNVPFADVVREDGSLRALDELRAIFSKAGIDLSKPVITTCGSGITAAILSLALECLDHRDHSLYDGSWAEWGDERNDPALFPVTAGGKVD